MTNYIYNLYEQKNINPSGHGRAEWITTKEQFTNHKATHENIEIATSKETMRFFRNLGSKQEIKRRYTKEGKEVVKIYSYCPSDINFRTVHEFKEQ